MDAARIASLLSPFLPAPGLTQAQLAQVASYHELLLKWNARINLTAVREPDEIITRHFGESFFLARHLFPSGVSAAAQVPLPYAAPALEAIDLGSGAGFPGLPLKIYVPALRLTLIESSHKKATFLHEAARTITSTDINIMSERAETLIARAEPPRAAVVTLRAVERFAVVLPLAAKLLAPGGRLALLIGAAQADQAHDLLPSLQWQQPIPIPLSTKRILLIGQRHAPAR